MNVEYPVPGKVNVAIAVAILVILTSLLIGIGYCENWWSLLAVSFAYGIIMNSGYAMLHEAEHNLLHQNKKVNDVFGVILALYFPAPFHLIRQGHIGHHLRNRSDDEAFDFYFEEDNPIWKYLQLYGILTGFFWITIVFSNLIAIVYPNILSSKKSQTVEFDRPTEALLETLNPKYLKLIRLEAILALLLHGGIIMIFNLEIWKYAVVLFGFGFIWSALQYVHHFETERDIVKGAKNLKTFWLLDLIWLNHNWHRVHHENPIVPWIYLPSLSKDKSSERESLLLSYFKMWKGPRKTEVRVKNEFAGKIIR